MSYLTPKKKEKAASWTQFRYFRFESWFRLQKQ